MKLNSYIDHTLLKPSSSASDIENLIQEALDHNFASVCVNGCWVAYAKDRLSDSEVKVATVVGFPLGASSTEAKANEAGAVVIDGADEIDMVMNVGWAKSGMWDSVRADIEKVVVNAHIAELFINDVLGDFPDIDHLDDVSNMAELHTFLSDVGVQFDFKVKVKVILETCLLSDDEIVKACECVKLAGADFVKSSTGFSTGGATVHHVALMRKTVGKNFGVKASGGIRTYEDAVKMVEAGANRLGTSASVDIVSKQGE